MRERSQLEDMRAALRGDLERARERRGETLLDPEPEPAELDAEPEAQVSDTPDDSPDVVEPVSDTADIEPNPELEPEPQAEVSDTPDDSSDVVEPVSDTTEPESEPARKRRFLWFLRD